MNSRKLYIISFAAIVLFSCQKNLDDGQLKKNSGSVSMNLSAPTFSYGDSIFYLMPSGASYTILPKVKPSVPGMFKAIPNDLVIDSVTGMININKSLSGLKYKVYYATTGNKLIDSTTFVISGIDYADSIYMLNNTTSAYEFAFPIYNAKENLALPCSDDYDDDYDDDDDDDEDDDEANKCVFNETDLDNDGSDDIGGVVQEKLLVDSRTGIIDVRGSFHAGIFGSSNPANGAKKEFKFYYRLNDISGMALNNITVSVYYFNKKSDIPASLLKQINDRKKVDQRVKLSPLPGNTMLSIEESSYLYFENYAKPRRPPIIVIIGQ